MDSTFSVAERPTQRGQPEGGFALILVWQLCRVWDAYQRGVIRFADLRVWLALCEAQERRCTLEEGRKPTYSLRELERLTGCSERLVKAALRRLAEQGLASFSTSSISLGCRRLDLTAESTSLATMLDLVQNHRRAVPLPRRTLRMLAQCGKPAVVATALAHLFRCVYYRTGSVVSWGRCKASWVAEAFGIDQRSVKSARAHLLGIAWLMKLPSRGSHALKRWGGEYQVELRWARPSSYAGSGFSPDPVGASTGFSPRNNQTPLPTGEIKNQTLDCVGKPGAKAGAGRAVGRKERKLGEPTLRHVEREDLANTSRTLRLFEQAGEQGLISRSEHGRLTFVGLAEHALLHGTRNPCGLFVKLLREKRHGYVTQDDEDAARRRINRELFPAMRERPVKAKISLRRVELSKDARIAQAVARVSADKRLSHLKIMRAMTLDWSESKYFSLLDEVESQRLRHASR